MTVIQFVYGLAYSSVLCARKRMQMRKRSVVAGCVVACCVPIKCLHISRAFNLRSFAVERAHCDDIFVSSAQQRMIQNNVGTLRWA